MLETPGFAFTIVAFLAVLGPLVFVHEYGHYIVGRWCGVKSDTFSIGFGRKIVSWTDKRGTEWKIGWLPLGGYVQFAGDRDAVSQPDAEWQQLPAEQKSHTFPAQPVWNRRRRTGHQFPVRDPDPCRICLGWRHARDAASRRRDRSGIGGRRGRFAHRRSYR
jgi:hypothetical protein